MYGLIDNICSDNVRLPQHNRPLPKQDTPVNERQSGRSSNISVLEVSIHTLLLSCCHGELGEGDHQNLDHASKMLASAVHHNGILRETVVSIIQRLVPKLDPQLKMSVSETVFNEINQHWAATSDINAGLCVNSCDCRFYF